MPIVTRDVLRTHPKLATCELPFKLEDTPLELVWRGSQDAPERCASCVSTSRRSHRD